MEVVFGMPGDGINGIMEALRKRQETDPLHPGAPRGSRRPSWPAATPSTPASWASAWPPPGPAASTCSTASTTPSWTASRCSPSPAITYHDLIDTHAQQDVDLDRVFADVAVYNTRVMGPAHVENVARPGLPDGAGLPRRRPHQLPRRSPGAGRRRRALEAQRAGAHLRRLRPRAPGCPTRTICARAAEVLNAGKKVAILAGPGRARRDRRAGAAGRDAGGADHQAAARQGGGAGRQPLHHRRHRPAGHAGRRRRRIEECDTLLMVGHLVPLHRVLPEAGPGARAVQIDLDPTRIGLRYPVEVGLVGDSRRTLAGAHAAAAAQRGPPLSRAGPGGHARSGGS